MFPTCPSRQVSPKALLHSLGESHPSLSTSQRLARRALLNSDQRRQRTRLVRLAFDRLVRVRSPVPARCVPVRTPCVRRCDLPEKIRCLTAIPMAFQDVIHKEDSPWESVPSVYRLRGGYDILLALDYIHQQGVLHRDIKSGNAFLHTPIVEGEALPTVKVGDMGFARPLSDYDAMTQGVGTLRYMAPEVLNSGEYNVTADMFSFSILLHELMSGNIPFQSRNEASLCLAILGGHRPPYEELFVDTSLSEEQIGVVWALMEAWAASRDRSWLVGKKMLMRGHWELSETSKVRQWNREMVDLSPQLRYLEFLEVLERANDQVFGFWLLEEAEKARSDAKKPRIGPLEESHALSSVRAFLAQNAVDCGASRASGPSCDPEIVAVPDVPEVLIPPANSGSDDEEEEEVKEDLAVQMDVGLGVMEVLGSTAPLEQRGVPEAHGHLQEPEEPLVQETFLHPDVRVTGYDRIKMNALSHPRIFGRMIVYVHTRFLA
ncbi:unnamed protein product [Durusdinium trenchii]|uniref:non-specific serine/threonine protein kinase n=1 Tax=Durusdinium trenchii TaxID=1381693 RepID=A0ABP0IRG3_9DINO